MHTVLGLQSSLPKTAKPTHFGFLSQEAAAASMHPATVLMPTWLQWTMSSWSLPHSQCAWVQLSGDRQYPAFAAANPGGSAGHAPAPAAPMAMRTTTG